MKIALLTMEALAAARAVRRFVAADPGRIALVGFSDPFRREAGGALGQTVKRLRASGPRLLPYLFLNFTAPRLVGALRPHPPEADVEATPLGRSCARLGIPTAEVGDVNGQAFRDRLAASGADLILTFHFDQILRAETIATAPRGGINVHCGLLPQHRGPVPTIHALLDELKDGEIEVRFRHAGLDELISKVDILANRLVFALLIAALIVGSSLLGIFSEAGVRFLGVSIFGLLGFVIAALLGLALLVGIVRSGRL